MALMKEVVTASDEALVYDNSGDEPVVVFAKYKDGRRYHLEPFPDWLRPYLRDQGIE